MMMEKLMKITGTNLMAVCDAEGRADVTGEAAVRIATQLIGQMTEGEMAQVARTVCHRLYRVHGHAYIFDPEALVMGAGVTS
jgi:hypothetical protein